MRSGAWSCMELCIWRGVVQRLQLGRDGQLHDDASLQAHGERQEGPKVGLTCIKHIQAYSKVYIQAFKQDIANFSANRDDMPPQLPYKERKRKEKGRKYEKCVCSVSSPTQRSGSQNWLGQGLAVELGTAPHNPTAHEDFATSK